MTDEGKPVEHPAKFSDPIIEAIAPYVLECDKILDCFGGVGKIGILKEYGFDGEITSNEFEPEWAEQGYGFGCDKVIVGDALVLKDDYPEYYDAIVTSPSYGNRMADKYMGDAAHRAKMGKKPSKRITYPICLKRLLTKGNSASLQWGRKYKTFHLKAWPAILECLSPGGLFVLNCSNHIRGGEEMLVTQWHVLVLQAMGLVVTDWEKVKTQRMGFGQNHDARVDHESVVVFRKVDEKRLG